MLRNATPLRKSAPGPPNISDDHISCTAPATETVSLQILFKYPTPASVFEAATKPSRFAHFWQGAESLAPTTQSHIWTSKSARNRQFLTLWTSLMPQRRALVQHLNFQKFSGVEVFLAFWLGHVLRATTACTFSTSQLPKVPRRCDIEVFCAFLTWKCASRHNSAQLFISHLAGWLRTRCFSEPTFQPSGAHWKNTVFRDFSNLSRACIIFLLTLSLLWFFPPLLFHLSILSEVWLLNFLRSYTYHSLIDKQHA